MLAIPQPPVPGGNTDGAALFIECLPHIDRAVAHITRRYRLEPAESEDLGGTVRLKLIENGYEALRRFEGRASLGTYISVIAQRALMDQRTALWGRWRPCRNARKAGAIGILLDRLLTRDGMAFDEACEVIRTHHGASVSRVELGRLSEQLPVRAPRRIVDAAVLERYAGPSTPSSEFDDAEEARLRGRLNQELRTALASVSAHDRLLLRLRYREGLSVAQIARLLHQEQAPLYRRYERLLALLRNKLDGESRLRNRAVRPSTTTTARQQGGAAVP